MLAAGLGLLAGCRSAPQQQPQTARSARSRSLHILLDRLTLAVSDGDRAAYDSLLSDADPGFAGTAAMIFDNLVRLQPSDVALRATGNTRRLSQRRAAVVGDRAYAAEVSVTWAVPGDRKPSDQIVWLTVAEDDDRLSWAGNTDGPQQPQPTPLWWLEPTMINSGARSTAIGGAQVDLRSWTRRADKAAQAVADQLTEIAGWNGRLVIIVPSNERLFEAMLGAEPGTRSALAAVTWPDGSRISSAPDRIVINPATSQRQSALGIDVLLAHEAVHVATRSPASAAPDWLVEGFADHLAYRAHPAAAGPAADLLLADVVRRGAPRDLPADDAFQSSGDDLDLTYLQAWSACRYLAERFGSDRLARYYAAVDGGDELGQAAEASFAIDHDQLVRGWRSWLRGAGDRGRI